MSESEDKIEEDKLLEDDSQTVMGQNAQNDEESAAQRRKNRKDVKWWQMEGQRRSQRVRGNLVAAPVKPKPESTFAEILRNIIPAPLL